jgi:hypothetical protein
MPKHDVTIEATSNLLELARNFEQKGNIQSALETYRQVLSQLDDENPLKKEIGIRVGQLEYRSGPKAFRGNPKEPDRQSWKLGIAFLTGLLLMGAIAIAFQRFSLHPSPTNVDQTHTPLYVVPQNAGGTLEVAPLSQTSSLTQTASPAQTDSPTATIYFLTIKADYVLLRAGPHFNHPEISKNYDKGTRMEILGSYYDWFYVKAPDGEKGWLFTGWVTIDSGLLTGIPTMALVPTAPSQPAQKTKRTNPYP